MARLSEKPVSKTRLKPDVVAYTFKVNTQEAQAGRLCKFKGSHGYTVRPCHICTYIQREGERATGPTCTDIHACVPEHAQTHTHT